MWKQRHDWWTAERTTALVKLWNDGASASEICRTLGAGSRNTIVGKVYRLRRQGVVLREKPVAASAGALRPFAPSQMQRHPRTSRAPILPPPPVTVFEPLPDTAPKPLAQRAFGECSWPVGDDLFCCAPVRAFGWCAPHVAVGRVPLNTQQRNLERALRRWV